MCLNLLVMDGTACMFNMVMGACMMGTCVACGDGITTGAETCDDGNTTAGDGCNATCATETGWACTGAPSTCSTVCGDGLLRGTEQCDDKNTTSGDGCSSTCQLDISCGMGEVPVLISNSTTTPVPDNYTGVISMINIP
jgi:cysteine-rich repeat protein